MDGWRGTHGSWKVLEFLVKFRGPGESWKMILVLESPGNLSQRSWNLLGRGRNDEL